MWDITDPTQPGIRVAVQAAPPVSALEWVTPSGAGKDGPPKEAFVVATHDGVMQHYHQQASHEGPPLTLHWASLEP